MQRAHQPDPQLVAAAEKILTDAMVKASTHVKRDFVMGYILLGDAHGWNLRDGDVALVHPDDVPKAVTLIRGVDPVWINAKLTEPGRCLFVGRKIKDFPIYTKGALDG